MASELAKQLQHYWGGLRFLTRAMNRMGSLELMVWLWKNGFSRNLHLHSVLMWDLQHWAENQVTGAHPYHDLAKVLVISNEASELAIYLWTKLLITSICFLPNTIFPVPSSLMFFQYISWKLLQPNGIIEEWFRTKKADNAFLSAEAIEC